MRVRVVPFEYGVVVLASVDGVIVGKATVTQEGMVRRVDVDAGFRRRGIALRLLREAARAVGGRRLDFGPARENSAAGNALAAAWRDRCSHSSCA